MGEDEARVHPGFDSGSVTPSSVQELDQRGRPRTREELMSDITALD